jgi:hypothetical protein
MATRSRFRVRPASKGWNTKGPDLLRTKDDARRQLSSILGPAEELNRVYVKVGDGKWRSVTGKGSALDRFDDWTGAGTTFMVSEKIDDRYEPRAVVQHESVRVIPLDNCSPNTSWVWSLIKHQFPQIEFGGGYVWKQVSGSTSWSDHAWGTAVDAVSDPEHGVRNDDVMDWVARMGAGRHMDYDYALGSRRGVVVKAVAPGFVIEPSTASTSHLWHVHVSETDHDGRRPPRTGGVW